MVWKHRTHKKTKIYSKFSLGFLEHKKEEEWGKLNLTSNPRIFQHGGGPPKARGSPENKEKARVRKDLGWRREKES